MATEIIEVEVHTICAGQFCMNVLHFAGAVTETDKFILAKKAVEAFDETVANAGFAATAYMSLLAGSCYLSAVIARVVGPNPGPAYPKLIAAADFPGTYSAELYSQQVAANFKLVTATGPDFTGRIFLPGVPEDALVRNRWTEQYVTEANVWIGNLMAGIEVDTGEFMTPAVYKRLTTTWELVTNCNLVPNPGTIRHRLSPV